MKCEKNIAQITDFLAGELTPDDRYRLSAHFTSCQPCGAEFDRLASVWQDLDQLPQSEPSPQLSKQFYAMLEGFTQGKEPNQVVPIPLTKRPFWSSVGFQVLAAAALLVLGFFAGRTPRTAPLVQPNGPMTTSMAWFNSPSAISRLQGVSNLTQASDVPQTGMFALLLAVLENDPSEDVRLAVLRALRPYLNEPQVRQGLVRTLPHQNAPLIQIEIMDALSQINDLSATLTIETLLQREPLNPHVKQRAEELLLEIR